MKIKDVAERVGFEPTYPGKGVTRFRVEPGTTSSVPLRWIEAGPEKCANSSQSALESITTGCYSSRSWMVVSARIS